jgi:hypothetical protein
VLDAHHGHTVEGDLIALAQHLELRRPLLVVVDDLDHRCVTPWLTSADRAATRPICTCSPACDDASSCGAWSRRTGARCSSAESCWRCSR